MAYKAKWWKQKQFDSRLVAFASIKSTNIYKNHLLLFYAILLTNKRASLLVLALG